MEQLFHYCSQNDTATLQVAVWKSGLCWSITCSVGQGGHLVQQPGLSQGVWVSF